MPLLRRAAIHACCNIECSRAFLSIPGVLKRPWPIQAQCAARPAPCLASSLKGTEDRRSINTIFLRNSEIGPYPWYGSYFSCKGIIGIQAWNHDTNHSEVVSAIKAFIYKNYFILSTILKVYFSQFPVFHRSVQFQKTVSQKNKWRATQTFFLTSTIVRNIAPALISTSMRSSNSRMFCNSTLQ